MSFKSQVSNRQFDLDTPLGKAMVRAGVSRDQLAEQSGVSVRTITYVARGKVFPTARTLAALATALRCRPGELIDPALYDDEAPNPA